MLLNFVVDVLLLLLLYFLLQLSTTHTHVHTHMHNLLQVLLCHYMLCYTHTHMFFDLCIS